MKCLCCGKTITEKASAYEKEIGWHAACIKRFFGTAELPELDISEETLMHIAAGNAEKGFTVPGVQKKMSLHLDTEGVKPRLTIVNYPTGYILKPQTDQYMALPEAEFLVMEMAKKTGISTVPFALVKTKDTAVYITKRVDRILPSRRNPRLEIFAMEDFCQLEQRLTENKYKGSYERCAKVITKYSEQPGLDLSELFMRIVFSYAVGNSDMHLKNFSLIEKAPGNGRYILSPAYDMLPVNLILPEDTDQTALTINGKKHNIRRKDFMTFAASVGIPEKAADRMTKRIVSMKLPFFTMCRESYLPESMKDSFCRLMEDRFNVLES